MNKNFNFNTNIKEFDDSGSFIDRHIGSSQEDIIDSLKYLGYSDLDQLIMDTLPTKIILDVDVDLDKPLSEHEALKFLNEQVLKNKIFKSYIGMGYSDTKTPTVILRNILENPGWYTAYTPYQPEVSQGRLEMLLN